MRFINPKTDFAFKKIFGSRESHDILISFLNGIIYSGKPLIKALVILNPYQAPQIRGLKSTYLDVKAELSTGESVIIEMQVLNVEGFQKRVLYNAAKTYSDQLKSGESYTMLSPVIALTITDFIMFDESSDPISRFVLKEKDYLYDYPEPDLELIFVELPKFKLSLDNLSTLSEKWIYFLQNAPDLESVPKSLDQVPAIQQAFSLANFSALTIEEQNAQVNQLFYISDQQKIRTSALQEGSIQTQKDIARRLLNMMDDQTIAQATGLSVEEVRCLR
ncbi:MAG: Rpn family recombination-promoting nuclease/putative transposase [Alkalinema sp. CAN_BIN05]|nr:Rpn family recombination-promoting nuclease/putative transposase [Alkalinema sp. CAN_BIN05]